MSLCRCYGHAKRVLSGSIVTSFIALWMVSQMQVMASDLKSTFAENRLTKSDSILVVEILPNGQQVTRFEWQSEKLLIPASLSKLVTTHVALDIWGKDYRFETNFYRDENTLWVKGFGDPFLVSEELEEIAKNLTEFDLKGIRQIAIDSTYFKDVGVPGRSKVVDPYNAPLNAVSANFNTTMLAFVDKQIVSAEPQTPLTPTASRVAKRTRLVEDGDAERVNLVDSSNAASHFGELLMLKLGLDKTTVLTGVKVPDQLDSFYVHKNSRNMATNIRGMMEYSNNFIANQLFLSVSGARGIRDPEDAIDNNEKPGASFRASQTLIRKNLVDTFGWDDFSVLEGAGLSRQNRLSAVQINDLLTSLQQVNYLFKDYSNRGASIRAKTGTLNGVRSFAGYISKGDRSFQFVFNFNRHVPYRHREALLKNLTATL